MIPPAAYMYMTGPYVPAPSPRPSVSPSMSLSVGQAGPSARLYASVALPQQASGPVAFDIALQSGGAPRLWYVGGDSWTGEVPLVRDGDGSVPAQTVYVPSYLESISFWDPPGAPLGCTAAVYAGAATAVSFGGADRALKGLTYATLGTSGQLREAMFMNCTALTGVLTSGGFDAVPASAFEGCVSLSSYPLSSTAKLNLGARCLYGCTSLAPRDGTIYTSQYFIVGEDCLAGCIGVSSVRSDSFFYMGEHYHKPDLVTAAGLSGLAKASQDGVVSSVQSRAGVEFKQGIGNLSLTYPIQTHVQFDGTQWNVLQTRS